MSARHRFSFSFVIFFFLLVGCSSQQNHQSGALPTNTPTPSATPILPTATPIPLTARSLPPAAKKFYRLVSDAAGTVWYTDGTVIGQVSSTLTLVPFASAHGYINSLVIGPDGFPWFVERGNSGAIIGHLTASHQLIELPVPDGLTPIPNEAHLGSDGNLWFFSKSLVILDAQGKGDFGTGAFIRVNPSGAMQVFFLAKGIAPDETGSTSDFILGADKRFWYVANHSTCINNPSTHIIDCNTDGPHLGAISMNGTIQEYSVVNHNASVGSIVSGSQGDLWYFSYYMGNTSFVHLTTNGVSQAYANGFDTNDVEIFPGPNGLEWVLSYQSHELNLGTLTTQGVMNAVFHTNHDPTLATRNPYVLHNDTGILTSNGILWYSAGYFDVIGHTTSSGSHSEVVLSLSGYSQASVNDFVLGAGDKVFYTQAFFDSYGNYLAGSIGIVSS
jgi:hypothetical protein